MMNINQLLLLEMKIANILKDGDNMEWYSPNREYVFEVNRYQNTLFNSVDDGSNYIIDIKIKNMIGVIISNIRVSEIDIIKTIDCFQQFLYDMDHQTLSSYLIGLEPFNSSLESYFIEVIRGDMELGSYAIDIEDLDPTQFSTFVDVENQDIRDIHFTLKKHNPILGNMINVLTFYISDSELEALIYTLYFVSLIDIEIPEQYLSDMNSITVRIANGGMF